MSGQRTERGSDDSGRSWSHRILLPLLGVSYLLRVVLVLRGGQLYFPDEGLYSRSLEEVTLLARGDGYGAVTLLARSSDHTGFLLLGLIPATVQHTLEQRLAMPPATTLWVPALALALSSVLVIALVAAVAKRAGGSERESIIAAALASSAATLFYFSRHLLPYDLSMALALLALWIGLDARLGLSRAFACGALVSLAFLTYNGYWLLGAVVCATCVLWRSSGAVESVARITAVGLGFTPLPAMLTVATVVARLTPLPLAMAQFAGSVVQGSYSEGWLLPWEYLWHAEHGLLLFWALGSVGALWILARQRGKLCARGAAWLAGASAVYLALAVPSTGLGIFVVYGRLAREMVPLLCLCTAFTLNYLMDRRHVQRPLVGYAAVLLALQVALNFAVPLAQQFPLEIERAVLTAYGPVRRDLTVKGPGLVGYEFGLSSYYILVNAQYLWPVWAAKKPPAGVTVLRAAHPLQFLPYQYEGYTPAERSILRSADLSIRLVRSETPTDF